MMQNLQDTIVETTLLGISLLILVAFSFGSLITLAIQWIYGFSFKNFYTYADRYFERLRSENVDETKLNFRELSRKVHSQYDQVFTDLSGKFTTALSKRLTRDLDQISSNHNELLELINEKVSEVGKDIEFLSGTQVFIRPLDSLKITDVRFMLDADDKAKSIDALSHGLPYLKLPGLARDPMIIRNHLVSMPPQNVSAFLECITKFTLDAELKGCVTVGDVLTERRKRPDMS